MSTLDARAGNILFAAIRSILKRWTLTHRSNPTAIARFVAVESVGAMMDWPEPEHS